MNTIITMECLGATIREKIEKYNLGTYWNNVPNQRLIYKPLLKWMEYIKLPKDTEILEGGCGLSCFFISLLNRGYDKYMGIDIKERNVKIALEIASEYGITPDLAVKDAHDTGLIDGQFGFVGYLNFSYFPKCNIHDLIEEGKRISNRYFAIDVFDISKPLTKEQERMNPVSASISDVIEWMRPFQPVFLMYPHEQKFFIIAERTGRYP